MGDLGSVISLAYSVGSACEDAAGNTPMSWLNGLNAEPSSNLMSKDEIPWVVLRRSHISFNPRRSSAVCKANSTTHELREKKSRMVAKSLRLCKPPGAAP
jgi:hypothetical protein